MCLSHANRLPHSIIALLAVLALAQHTQAITLVDTIASLMNPEHTQVDTAGGSQPHLLLLTTPTATTHSAIDVDLLLADGHPLVMTWQRDTEDSDIITFSVAAVVDHSPQHLEISFRPNNAPAPVFHAIGTITPSNTINETSSTRTDSRFSTGIAPDEDVNVGDTEDNTALTVSGTIPWQIDISSLPVGSQFDIVLRAGPPGDWDDDHDLDLADYFQFHNCFDAQDLSGTCRLLFDLDADNKLDLYDFALLQAYFSGEHTTPDSED